MISSFKRTRSARPSFCSKLSHYHTRSSDGPFASLDCSGRHGAPSPLRAGRPAPTSLPDRWHGHGGRSTLQPRGSACVVASALLAVARAPPLAHACILWPTRSCGRPRKLRAYGTSSGASGNSSSSSSSSSSSRQGGPATGRPAQGHYDGGDDRFLLVDDCFLLLR